MRFELSRIVGGEPVDSGEHHRLPGVERHLHFPTTCFISLLFALHGASAEIAAAGNEAILGISLLMAGNTTPSRAIVQSSGHAYRPEADLLKDEF